MKSYSSGLSGPVHSKRAEGLPVYLPHPATNAGGGGGFPEGRPHAVSCRTQNAPSSFLTGSGGPTGLPQQSMQPPRRTQLYKVLTLSCLAFSPPAILSLSLNHRGSIHRPGSEIIRVSNGLLPLSRNLTSKTPSMLTADISSC